MSYIASGSSAKPDRKICLARAPFAQVILVCEKCRKKLAKRGDGSDLRSAMKRALKSGR